MIPRPFFLERYFARFEFVTRYLLSGSDCETLTVSDLLTMADPADRDAFLNLQLAYTESDGLAELRELVANQLGVSSGNIVVAAPEEAIYLTMRALLRPDDRVVATFPGYQSLTEIAIATGCRVERWLPEETGEGWRFDLDRLEELTSPGVRAIVANFPHNPTGAVLDPDKWQRLRTIADRAGAYLISDEMYRGLEHGPVVLPPAVSADGKSVSIGGLSKAYGLPGLRIGWVATRDEDLLCGIRAFHDYTTICNSGPSERLAVIALKNAAKLQARCRSIVAGNLQVAESFLNRHADRFAWRRPAAGPVAFIRYCKGGAQAFCEQAGERAGIVMVPSPVFEWGDSHIRLGLGRKNLSEGLDALASYIEGL